MSLYQYSKAFFDYQQIGSLMSARAVSPLVMRHLKPASILDVGCGAGAWAATYIESGVADVIGVDGDYVRPDQLLFNPARFRSVDVTTSFRLGRTFDLVQCLEVAEHLNPAASETLVDNLVAHAPIVVFSAAPPGQGGENHINERPYAYWRDLFAMHRYALFDFLRPQLRFRIGVELWYRYNMLVFVRHDAIAALSPAVAATRVDELAEVPDLSPHSWRLRRRMLSALSPRIVTRIAALKHRVVLLKQGAATQPS